jgi:hypothetical protein
MVFHLVARGAGSGSWREFPSENWIVLNDSDWKRLLPSGAPALQASWEIAPEISGKLYEWIYPQTEDASRVNRSRIEKQSMRMTIVAMENGIARARIDGSLQMRHSFYPGRDTNETVNATITGFMDFDPAHGRIQRLRIVTDRATYNNQPFDAAVRSVSRETLDAMGG